MSKPPDMSSTVEGFSVNPVTIRRYPTVTISAGRPVASDPVDTSVRMHLYPGGSSTQRRQEGQEGLRVLKGSYAGELRVANQEACLRADILRTDWLTPGSVRSYEVQMVNAYTGPDGGITYVEFEAGEVKRE